MISLTQPRIMQWMTTVFILANCLMADAATKPVKPVHPHIIYNDDGFNFLTLGDDLGVKDLRAYLSRLCSSYRVGRGFKPAVNFSK